MTIDAVNDFLNADKPEPLIVNGRYRIRGEFFSRASSFNCLDDRFSLEKWQQRMVGSGLILRPDLAVLWAANLDDKNTLNDLCEQSIEAAKGHAGANVGTALHSLAEQVDRGETPVIPAPYDTDIVAYTATLEANGVRVDPELMELVVVNRDLGVAGRYDRLVGIDGYPLPMIADLKTGDIEFNMLGIAVQLAIYAYADEVYDPLTDTLTPMPRVDLNQALVIHLPAGQGTCTLHMVDIKTGWEAAQECKQVREWRKRGRTLATKFESTATERAKWLAARVATMKDRYPDALAELAKRWPEGVPTFKQGGHSDDDLLLLSMLITDVEARHSVEFATGDPDQRRPAPQIVEGLIERAARLPEDLRQIAERRGRDAGIPNVRHRTFVVAHVELVERILDEIEAMHAGRLEAVTSLIGEMTGGDTALVNAVLDVCGTDGTTWSHQQADVLIAVAAGMSNLHLAYGATEAGVTTIEALAGEQRLVEWFGSKKDALAVCKQVAEAAGLDKPRSVADAVANPALFALVANHAINQGKQVAA